MANVKMNPVFEGFSKKIGDLVFVQTNGKTYVRKKVIPRQVNSEAQQRIRALFRETVEAWKELSRDTQNNWDEAARGKAMSGYNLFIRVNMKRLKTGKPAAANPVD